MKSKILAVGIMVVAIGLFSWMSIGAVSSIDKAKQERFTYMGRVTAISNGNRWTTVWLDSNAQSIRIGSNNLQLVVGKEYQIILDGNDDLINVAILPEP